MDKLSSHVSYITNQIWEDCSSIFGHLEKEKISFCMFLCSSRLANGICSANLPNLPSPTTAPPVAIGHPSHHRAIRIGEVRSVHRGQDREETLLWLKRIAVSSHHWGFLRIDVCVCIYVYIYILYIYTIYIVYIIHVYKYIYIYMYINMCTSNQLPFAMLRFPENPISQPRSLEKPVFFW